MKKYCYNMAFWVIQLIYPFLRINYQQKLMTKDTLTQIKKKENERGEKIKEELGCKFIRITPDKKDYNEYVEFSEINNSISESNKRINRRIN